MQDKKKQKIEVSVRTVLRTLELLSAAGSVEDFVAECERRGLSVSVDADLKALGYDWLKALPNVEAAGPDCPACPPPR